LFFCLQGLSLELASGGKTANNPGRGKIHLRPAAGPFIMIKHPHHRSGAVFSRVLSWRETGGLALSVTLLTALAGAAYAADPPTPVPPVSTTATQSSLLPAPVEAMTRMADNLDKDSGFVVAMVAGSPITKGDVADAMRAMPVSLASLGYKALFTRAMDQLLRQRLAAASAEKQGLDKDPTVSRREKTAADRVLAEAWVDRQADAAVTEQALHARYDREIAGKPGPEEVRARVILTASESEARDLIAKIQAGAEFSDVARQSSNDMSAAQGGDIGYVPLDALSAEVGATMFALSPGQMTAFPVRTLPGYFIIRVEGRRQRATPTFEEARPSLVAELRREAATAALNGLTSDIKVQTSK
jgi:peptidyl-prolyl cis-trans isomerase C